MTSTEDENYKKMDQNVKAYFDDAVVMSQFDDFIETLVCKRFDPNCEKL